MTVEQTAEAAGPPEPAASTVLVVDDELLAREVLTDLLESQGFRVRTASRGDQIEERIDGVDLVLLDAMLPDRDGWSICEEIKETHGPLFPVIMVTARTAPEDIVRTFAAGADDYIPKPFNVAELAARVRSRIRIHEAEEALKRANRTLADLANQNYQLYEQARRDAEERARLLRELDHRVRNSLSVITGLVSMERNRRPPRATDAALASLEHRMRAYLVVHQALRGGNYRWIPLREIAEGISMRLRNAIDPDQNISIRIEGDPIEVTERQGFPLALVLNELVSNALEHAFPGERPGQLCITLREQDGEVLVTVEDDGVGGGASSNGSLLEERGSGRSIVRTLVEGELGGRLEVDGTEQGTRIAVHFGKDEVDGESPVAESAESSTKAASLG